MTCTNPVNPVCKPKYLILSLISGYRLKYSNKVMYQSNRSLNIPSGYTPGIWRLFLSGREGIWWTYKSFPGRGIWSLLIGGGEFDRYPRFRVTSRADSTWRDKSWRTQALMHSKRKIPDSWRTGWKAKACTSFALYLKLFKNHVYYLWHLRALFVKVTRPSFFWGVPSYFEALWYPHLYFYRKSNT